MSSGIPGWWSMLLASIGIAGLYLTTRPEPVRWYGFIVGLAVQALWIAYAVTTHQLGFVVSAIAYGAVNAIGIRKWLRQRHNDAPGFRERLRERHRFAAERATDTATALFGCRIHGRDGCTVLTRHCPRAKEGRRLQ